MAKSKTDADKGSPRTVRKLTIPADALTKGLPDGAKIIQADLDPETGDLKAVVHHESFDEWDPTEAMPEHEGGHHHKTAHHKPTH